MNISRTYLNQCLDHLITQVNQTNLKTIYSYTGDHIHSPIYYEETKLFENMWKKTNLTCSFVEVSDSNFSPSNWNPKTSLIHIPGAVSSELDKHLGSKMMEIKDFVQKGGRFLGWCGGGYWACHKVSYRINDQTYMEKFRNLAFWRGTEQGPLLPYLGNPEDNIGFFHGAVKIKWTGSEACRKYFPNGLELHSLLSGGGSFIPAEDEHSYKILATYEGNIEKSKSYAGVKTYIGKGSAILMNPYFTHGADYFREGLVGYQTYFPQHNWSKIVSDLQEFELENTICFVDMLLEATQDGREVS